MNEPGLFQTVTSWNPDAFLVAGWYHMIPKIWRNLAPAYGLHASLLPDYSGGAPLVWAMINGETKTGVTLFQMDDGVDSGPIVA
jgi:methionyl-tRNA formyltransferase